MSARRCTVCRGRGCVECDGTGRRYRKVLELDGGATMRVSGSGEGEWTPEQAEALEALGRAAIARMDERP